MLGLRRHKSNPDLGLVASCLHNDQTFYRVFEKDLALCRNEAVIESPFITTRRIKVLLPILRRMVTRGVRVTINTRHPQEHEDYLRIEAEKSIAMLQDIGVEVLFTGEHHRKLAIFDRTILWEGSLNILSQSESCEIMRRIASQEQAQQMLDFIGIQKFL